MDECQKMAKCSDRENGEKSFLYKANPYIGRAFLSGGGQGPSDNCLTFNDLVIPLGEQIIGILFAPQLPDQDFSCFDGEARSDPWTDRVRRGRQGPILHEENTHEKVRKAKPARTRSASVGHEIQRPSPPMRMVMVLVVLAFQ
jgi:hypothetical protein